MAKQVCSMQTVGLLIVDKGDVEPGINVIKKVLVNRIRQIEGGIHPDTAEYWEEFNVQIGN
eukprot:3132496-Heterocapsa_arctica.AAC.1